MDKSLRVYKLSFKSHAIFVFSIILFLGTITMLYMGYSYGNNTEAKITLFSLSAISFLLSIYFFKNFKRIPKYSFGISENRIEVKDNKLNKVIYKFTEIADVFLYSTGHSLYKNNLVFRINSHSPWYRVNTFLNNYERFSDDFLSNYFKYKTPYYLDKIDKGENIEFTVIDKKSKLKIGENSDFNNQFKKLKTKSLILNKDKVTFDGSEYFLKNMLSIKDTHLGFLEFQDLDGKIQFKIHEDNFFSLEVFLALYDCVMNDYFIEREISNNIKKHIK